MKNTSSPPVNYNLIASSYNSRYPLPAEGEPRGQMLLSLAAQVKARRILEVGCGTGHWLSGLLQSKATLFGLDLSQGMLGEAHLLRGKIYLTRGCADRLPFASGSLDLVYCVDAIHHFDDKLEFLYEAYRLLHTGGMLAILGSDPHSDKISWFGYEYFPEVRERDLQRFTSHKILAEWMASIGFTPLSARIIGKVGEPKIGRKILDDLFLQKQSSSQLALLSEQEYQAGVDKIEKAIENAEKAGQTVVFESNWPIRILTGVKR